MTSVSAYIMKILPLCLLATCVGGLRVYIRAPAQKEPQEHLGSSFEGDRTVSVLARENNVCEVGREITVNGKKYCLLEMVGSGGTASIHKVKDASSGEVKALKVINKKRVGEYNEFEARNEIAIHEKLKNVSSVVQLYDVENKEDVLLMVMEYAPSDLHGFFHKFSQTKLQQIKTLRDITKKVLFSLDKLHDKGIVHLDVKPQNFVVSDDGSVRAIDFGSSMATGEDNKAYITMFRRNTVAYSAPEVLREKYANVDPYECERRANQPAECFSGIEIIDALLMLMLEKGPLKKFFDDDCKRATEVDMSADVWSFGAMLYQFMYGDLPHQSLFAWKEYMELVYGNVVDNRVIIRAMWRPGYKITFPAYEDPILAQMVKDCLQRDPALRPTIKELLRRLD